MKRKAKIQLVEALSDYSQKMVETSGSNYNLPLLDKNEEPCDTELILHLKDGTKITLSNRREESTNEQVYYGDTISNVCDLLPKHFEEVDYLDVEIRGNVYSRKRIPLECVAWVEMNQEPINK